MNPTMRSVHAIEDDLLARKCEFDDLHTPRHYLSQHDLQAAWAGYEREYIRPLMEELAFIRRWQELERKRINRELRERQSA